MELGFEKLEEDLKSLGAWAKKSTVLGAIYVILGLWILFAIIYETYSSLPFYVWELLAIAALGIVGIIGILKMILWFIRAAGKAWRNE